MMQTGMKEIEYENEKSYKLEDAHFISPNPHE